MTERDEPDSLPRDLRTDWHRYVDSLVPLRPALFAYCRRLAGSVWDAEDLVQDTFAFDGEWIAAFFVQGDGPEALTNVMRFDECEGQIARIRFYGFCPDTIRTIAEALGVPAWTGIYRAPTPAPGEDWPGEASF